MSSLNELRTLKSREIGLLSKVSFQNSEARTGTHGVDPQSPILRPLMITGLKRYCAELGCSGDDVSSGSRGRSSNAQP